MPTILGKTVTQATVDRVIAAFNVGRDTHDADGNPKPLLTGVQVQALVRAEVISKVRRIEKAQAIAAADHESNFDLV